MSTVRRPRLLSSTAVVIAVLVAGGLFGLLFVGSLTDTLGAAVIFGGLSVAGLLLIIGRAFAQTWLVVVELGCNRPAATPSKLSTGLRPFASSPPGPQGKQRLPSSLYRELEESRSSFAARVGPESCGLTCARAWHAAIFPPRR